MRHCVSVGLDVSKATVEAAVLFSNQTHEGGSFNNTADGLAELAAWCKQHGVASATPCVIESTGDYHLLSALTLTNAGYTVNVINPIITKQYQRSSIRDAKTDRIDALRLARIGLLETDLRPFTADRKALGAKKALSLIATLEETKQRLVRSSRQFKETQQTLGLPVSAVDIDTLIRQVTQQVTLLYEHVQRLAPKAAQELARTTPGVSERQVAVLATALAGASFTDRDQVVAFVGLDVRKRESGQWHGKEKLSKRGNPFVRKVLFQIGWSLKQHNEIYRQYYDQLRARGKHYYTCLLALARKFLRFFYAVVLRPQVVAA